MSTSVVSHSDILDGSDALLPVQFNNKVGQWVFYRVESGLNFCFLDIPILTPPPSPVSGRVLVLEDVHNGDWSY